MNVRELMDKLSRLDPNLPVVIDQEDIELFGCYVECMDVRFSASDVYFDPKGFSLYGSRPYDRADWGYTKPGEQSPATEPVVLLSCKSPWKPTIDGELAHRELEANRH